MHIDIGFGDAVAPGAIEIEYPSLLDLPAAHLRAYPPETVLANGSRKEIPSDGRAGNVQHPLKDFFDIWAIFPWWYHYEAYAPQSVRSGSTVYHDIKGENWQLTAGLGSGRRATPV